MSSFHQPDGPEARTAFYEETYERDLADLDVADMLADEARDDPMDALMFTLALRRMAMEDAHVQNILDGATP